MNKISKFVLFICIFCLPLKVIAFKPDNQTNTVNSTNVEDYLSFLINNIYLKDATVESYNTNPYRLIVLNGEINKDKANKISTLLLNYDSISNDPIFIFINSTGGDIYSALEIYDTMQFVSSKVYTFCPNIAASAAVIIMCAGEQGYRYTLPQSHFMIHSPSNVDTPKDTELAKKEIEKLKDELCYIISLHSGQDISKVKEDCRTDYWMSADEAIKYGLIDKIIKTNK